MATAVDQPHGTYLSQFPQQFLKLRKQSGNTRKEIREKQIHFESRSVTARPTVRSIAHLEY
jgi:hypothetical protein